MARTKVYLFDRYVGSALMAEGARVTTAKTKSAALAVAKRLFAHDSQRARFVLRRQPKPVKP